MENFLGFLGLSRRASMLAAGEGPVREALFAREARLVLLASDAAPNTDSRYSRLCEAGGVAYLRIPVDKRSLGAALGQGTCAVCAITDVGFADEIAKRVFRLTGDERALAVGEKLALARKRQKERRELKEAVRRGKAPPRKKDPPAKEPGRHSAGRKDPGRPASKTEKKSVQQTAGRKRNGGSTSRKKPVRRGNERGGF